MLFFAARPVTQYLKVSSYELENIVKLSGEDELSRNWQIDSSVAADERMKRASNDRGKCMEMVAGRKIVKRQFLWFLRETSLLVINLYLVLSSSSPDSYRRV